MLILKIRLDISYGCPAKNKCRSNAERIADHLWRSRLRKGLWGRNFHPLLVKVKAIEEAGTAYQNDQAGEVIETSTQRNQKKNSQKEEFDGIKFVSNLIVYK